MASRRRPCSSLGWASPNWSGYAVTAGPYTSASGTWVVPAVRATATPTYSSTWVGIDGFANESLIQVGTAQSFHDGQAFYSAWWEVLPAVAQPISSGLGRAGRHHQCDDREDVGGPWTITLRNRTSGEEFSTTEAYSGPGASAEWIQEAPTVGGRIATLASYGSTTFTATANGKNPGFALRHAGAMLQGGAIVSMPDSPATASTAATGQLQGSSDRASRAQPP